MDYYTNVQRVVKVKWIVESQTIYNIYAWKLIKIKNYWIKKLHLTSVHKLDVDTVFFFFRDARTFVLSSDEVSRCID